MNYSEGARLVILLGYDIDHFFIELKTSTVEAMQECLEILSQPDKDEYMAMLSNAARWAIIEEAFYRIESN